MRHEWMLTWCSQTKWIITEINVIESGQRIPRIHSCLSIGLSAQHSANPLTERFEIVKLIQSSSAQRLILDSLATRFHLCALLRLHFSLPKPSSFLLTVAAEDAEKLLLIKNKFVKEKRYKMLQKFLSALYHSGITFAIFFRATSRNVSFYYLGWSGRGWKEGTENVLLTIAFVHEQTNKV